MSRRPDQLEQRLEPLGPVGEEDQPVAVDRDGAGRAVGGVGALGPDRLLHPQRCGRARGPAQARDFLDLWAPRHYLARLPEFWLRIGAANGARYC